MPEYQITQGNKTIEPPTDAEVAWAREILRRNKVFKARYRSKMNPRKCSSASKQYQREYQKIYRSDPGNKIKSREYLAKYRIENREKIRESSRQYAARRMAANKRVASEGGGDE